MARVLLFGGHGKVALLTIPLLVRAGHRVTAAIRNSEHAAAVSFAGAEPIMADAEQLSTETMAELIRDRDVVIWSAGAGGGDPARTRAVDRDAAIRSIDAAAAANVSRYVMVSYYGARPDHGVPTDNAFWHYAEAKADADEYLRNSELDWTILGPSTLTMDEPTGLIDARVGYGPQGNGDSSHVSRGNVARVLAAVVDAGGPGRTTLAFNDGDTPIDEVVADALAAR